MYEQTFRIQADVLKALAHSRRLEIVQLLHTGELSVTDIYQMLDLPQANVSQHLMILKDSGVLSARKKGKQIFYRVTDKNIFAVLDYLRRFLVRNNKLTSIANELSLDMGDFMPLHKDPVCGMRISEKNTPFTFLYKQTKYYFCASGCLKQFTVEPEKYV